MRLLGLVAMAAYAFLIGPLLIVVGSAFGGTRYLRFPPEGLTLRWFGEAMAQRRYLDALEVSLVLACVVTVLSLLIGVPAAYALARRRFPGRAVLDAVVTLPLVLPSMTIAVSLALTFARAGILSNPVRLVLSHLVICAPYVVRVVLPVIEQADVAVEEAARSLGASPLATFFHVTLPAIRGGVLAAALLALIVSIDDVDIALLLCNPAHPTLPMLVYAQVQYGPSPIVGAISALLILGSAAVMLMCQLAIQLRRRV